VCDERAEPVELSDGLHRPVEQWELRESGPQDGVVHIQLGALTGEDWYVDHLGFGIRRFRGRRAALAAVRRLMRLHEGRWAEVSCDRRPFLTVRRSNGSRVLYDMNDDVCLYGAWGVHKERWWGRYSAAIDAGTQLRYTHTHAFLEGFIALHEYRDPMEGSTRYALARAREGGSDYRVVDYPDRRLGETEYEQTVRDTAEHSFPYRSSDVAGVHVDELATEPPGFRRTPSGAYVADEDVDEYEKLYGPIDERY
jgi:hypothetical protein